MDEWSHLNYNSVTKMGLLCILFVINYSIEITDFLHIKVLKSVYCREIPRVSKKLIIIKLSFMPEGVCFNFVLTILGEGGRVPPPLPLNSPLKGSYASRVIPLLTLNKVTLFWFLYLFMYINYNTNKLV